MPKKEDFDSGRDDFVGRQMHLYDYVCFGGWDGSVELIGLSIRIPAQRHEDVLVVLRGHDSDGGPVVAFHSEPMVANALAGAARRLADGQLKWREDEYRSR
jgi:hypothetical protein